MNDVFLLIARTGENQALLPIREGGQTDRCVGKERQQLVIGQHLRPGRCRDGFGQRRHGAGGWRQFDGSEPETGREQGQRAGKSPAHHAPLSPPPEKARAGEERGFATGVLVAVQQFVQQMLFVRCHGKDGGPPARAGWRARVPAGWKWPWGWC